MTTEENHDTPDRAALEHQAEAARSELDDTLLALEGKVTALSKDALAGVNVAWIGALGGALLALAGLRRTPRLPFQRRTRPAGALFGLLAGFGVLVYVATRASRDGSPAQ